MIAFYFNHVNTNKNLHMFWISTSVQKSTELN